MALPFIVCRPSPGRVRRGEETGVIDPIWHFFDALFWGAVPVRGRGMQLVCGHDCLRGMAGNGKTMAIIEQANKEEEEEKEKETKERERKRGGKVIAEVLGVAETTAAATKRRARLSEKDGSEMLKQASDQALVEITDDIVTELKKGARKGNVVCVKALMEFSEKKKPRPKRKKKSALRQWMDDFYRRSVEDKEWVDKGEAGGPSMGYAPASATTG